MIVRACLDRFLRMIMTIASTNPHGEERKSQIAKCFKFVKIRGEDEFAIKYLQIQTGVENRLQINQKGVRQIKVSQVGQAV